MRDVHPQCAICIYSFLSDEVIHAGPALTFDTRTHVRAPAVIHQDARVPIHHRATPVATASAATLTSESGASSGVTHLVTHLGQPYLPSGGHTSYLPTDTDTGTDTAQVSAGDQQDKQQFPQIGIQIHTIFTSNGSPYQNWQVRVLLATWEAVRARPGGDNLVALTRILHRKADDVLSSVRCIAVARTLLA